MYYDFYIYIYIDDQNCIIHILYGNLNKAGIEKVIILF